MGQYRSREDYSITSSALATKVRGTVTPSAFAVLRSITISNFVEGRSHRQGDKKSDRRGRWRARRKRIGQASGGASPLSCFNAGPGDRPACRAAGGT